ncbi:hypothetical protein MBLNU230_g6153t1 [Neophaeotheca triangularis]
MDPDSNLPPSSHPGSLHFIPPSLSAFEPSRPTHNAQTPTNTLLWVGGMFDTYLSVAYPIQIARDLPATWSLATCSLSSAGYSWGTSSIARDAKEMGKIVEFFRKLRPEGKIVIMGHSTGCQDCMEYLVGEGAGERPPVDGAILQAPVSDREAIEGHLPKGELDEFNGMALRMCEEGRETDAMPARMVKGTFGRIAITAKRWIDIASPAPERKGADDYFSSDLSDDRLRKTFGKVPGRSPLLILYSGSEENVPAGVDKEAMVKRWMMHVREGGGVADETDGGVVPGATHNLNGNPEGVVQDLVSRVAAFIHRVGTESFQQEKATL